ncbi:MAG: glycosyltransferase family 4 protein [Candidatus Poribacteria bacterium]|nr:glycosyltransferase family 4 protein [Candidatus Poribacteria bacterium]
MILDQRFPPDIRVEKEARTLIRAGHTVHLLCRLDTDEMRDQAVHGIHVHRRVFLYPDNFLAQKWNNLNDLFAFRNPKLIREIKAFIQAYGIDILHVHDLPPLRSALDAVRESKIQVIADLHENYPAAIQFYNPPQTLKGRFAYNTNRWKKYESQAVRRVDHVIVVVDEAKARLVDDCNLPPEQITVISNTEDVDYFAGLALNSEIINSYQGQFVLTYVGGFGSHRGIDVPIRALPQLIEKIPNVKLLLVGDGNIRSDLEELVRTHNVSDYVEFTGWQPFELMPTYIALSDICLVPHHANPHTDATVPHKLFQYMLLEKPVVVSSCRPLARIVRETKAGLVFESGNCDDFARRCLELIDRDKRQLLGASGRKAILEKYNWAKTGVDLVGVYERFANG